MDSSASEPFRIGHGYDLHRLEPLPPDGRGRPFILAGVPIAHDAGPVGHSDGDAALHAATDAIFGALALPDIGQQFPDDDPQYEGADSIRFLEAAREAMERRGYRIGNLDLTIICERPKVGPYKHSMIANLATALGCEESRINLKGKTHEQVDAVGEGRAIEVHAVVLLVQVAAGDSTWPDVVVG